MGMQYQAIVATDGELETVLKDLDALDELSEETEEAERSAEIDKMWDGLRFLLEACEAKHPGAGQMVLGGLTVSDEEYGYGPAYYKRADQVKRVFEAISPISNDELLSHYDAVKMKAAEIYPDIWDDEEEAQEEILDAWGRMRELYAFAAGKGLNVIHFVI